MGIFRFALLFAGVFTLTLVGASWACKAFPVMVAAVGSLEPDSRHPTLQESVQSGLGQAWENSRTTQRDGNVARDKLRVELLQASNAFAVSPCDDSSRDNFVTALTGYARARYEMAHCRPGAGDCPTSSHDRFGAAVSSFRTSADIRVREALQKAFDESGISPEAFPAPLRTYIVGLAYMSPGEPRCRRPATRQAEYRR